MISKFIQLLLDLYLLRLDRKIISKLEKEREKTKYIFIDGEIDKGED